MKSTLLLIIMLGWSKLAIGQTLNIDAGKCEKFMPAVQPYIEQGIFQGNILVAKEGQVLCQLSYGYADENQQSPITPSSRFPIASLSKPIVATLLLKLQEHGTVDLQKSIAHYLPTFPAPWADAVTLEHLLSNRSGLPNHFMLPGWESKRYQKSLPQQELLSEIANMSLSFKPGEQYQYSNLGWLLLGEIVEKATQKSLAKNLSEYVFSPLSMTQSGMVYQTEVPMIRGFRWGKNGGWTGQTDMHMQVFHGGAGIYSTSEDLVKYLAALHQSDLLSAVSKSVMFSPDESYAWNITNIDFNGDKGKLVHTYNGQLKGHSSFVYQVLEDNVSLVLLNNTGMGIHHKRALANDVLSTFYDVPFPTRFNAPSFRLHRSLLDNNWSESLATLTAKPLEQLQQAVLVYDLAQQLEWSGNTTKAIDLFAWLVKSLPDEPSVKSNLERLCQQNADHKHCLSKEKLKVGMQVLPFLR